MDQAIDTIFDFDECAEVSEVPYPAFDVRPTGYLSCRASQGLAANWRIPNEIRRSVGFTFSTTHST